MSLCEKDLFAQKAAFILEKAQDLGAEQISVHLQQSEGQSLQWREGVVEELNREQQLSVDISVLKHQSMGHCSISDWSEKALISAVKAAMDSAAYTEADEYFGLPEPQHYAKVDEAQIAALQLDSGVLANADTLEKQSKAMESAAKAHDERIVLCDGASASTGRAYTYLAQSNGFGAGYFSSHVGLSVSVLAREGQEQQSAYRWDGARFDQDLQAPEKLGCEAAERAIAKLHPQSIASGEYPIIFDKEVAASLLRHIVQALEGRAQYRQLSFLRDSLGEQILPEFLSLQEAPYLPRALASLPFDSEGLMPANSAIVEHGVVKRYILSSYAARRLHMSPTGNGGGVHNLHIKSSQMALPVSALYEKMQRGIVITALMGQGVDLLTGDYSRGASGFWVENGVIAHAVEGLTIAGNLREMLKNIIAIADDADQRRSIQAPSILIEKMVVAQ